MEIEIKIREIRSAGIIAIPSETVTGKMFRNANIARIRTKDGGDYDVIFDAYGNPLTDLGLTNRIGKFYDKRFEMIKFDGRAAFGQVHTDSEIGL